MQTFSFGARDNSTIQFAYTVDDIHEGMRRYTDLLRIGPWFLIGCLSRRRHHYAHQLAVAFCTPNDMTGKIAIRWRLRSNHIAGLTTA
jgi:hypothetical protein